LFKSEDGIKKAGSYCLTAAALITSDNKTEALFHLPNGKALPSAKQINFTVIAGPPKRFIICDERIEALIGKSFDLSLKFFDEYDNEAKPVLQTDIFPVFTLKLVFFLNNSHAIEFYFIFVQVVSKLNLTA
jgi:hypothetical protein